MTLPCANRAASPSRDAGRASRTSAAPDDLDLQCATRVVSAPRPCGLGRSRWQTSPGRWALRINGQQRKGSPSQRSPSSRKSPSGLAVSWRSPELAQNPSARPPTSRNSYSGCSIIWLAKSRFSLLLPRKTRSRRARSWKRVIPSPGALGSATRREALSQRGAMPQQARGRLPGFCRDCRRDVPEQVGRCSACGSPRLLRHPDIDTLAIAHVDCDAFYATIEKRDDPSIADKPVIVGGGQRGVVLTCCYVARTFGVRSAMPMFEARRLCPHATIVRPRMDKYAEVGRAVRARMRELTPLVEPVSIDEAFMDLSGTERLHGMPPAKSLARFSEQVERELGVTVSIGLAANKFLAKIASDLDKPRGFAILGAGEAAAFLAPKSVSLIFGVGKVAQARLAKDGLRSIGDLQRAGESELMRRYGGEGVRLSRLAHGRDERQVKSEREAKSISAETTFEQDIAELRPLAQRLLRLSEKVSARLKATELAGTTVTLKLKGRDFRLRTRAQSFERPTQLAGKIFATGRELLARELDGTQFRLIGIGVSGLCAADDGDRADLLDRRAAEAEFAIDRLREKFGDEAIVKGLSLDDEEDDWEE